MAEARQATAKEWAKWQAEAAQARAVISGMVRAERRQMIRSMTWCEVVELWKEAHGGDSNHDGRPK